MANEILYSGLGDLRLAAVLSQEIDLLLADRASLMGHPAIVYKGDLAGRGSTVLEVAQAGLGGYDRMSAVAENSAVSNTALTDASPSITIARQALRREYSDLGRLTDSVGLTVQALAADMVASASLRFTEMVCNVADDFTTTVGSTGVNMSVDDWYDAQFALTQASVQGPYVSLLFPTQLTDLQSSLRSESGALQWQPATAQMIAIKGQGFAGSFNGVDVFTSSLVPTANAGADSAGAMFGYGAIGYADGSVAPINAGTTVLPAGQKVFVELDRDADKGHTIVVGNYYVGVSLLQDAMGVSIITDR